MTQGTGQADAAGKIEGYKGRGVYLCPGDLAVGTTAAEIMEGAWVLERDFDVLPYTSRMMVSAVLAAIRNRPKASSQGLTN